MDRLSPSRRSWNMAQIRARDTTPELAVRSALHRLGLRFRLRSYGLPGRPDVVLVRRRVAVFVHGCFWHRHKGCRLAYSPKSNTEFWFRKFEDNVSRDMRNRRALQRLAWRVVVVWECQSTDPIALARRLDTALAVDRDALGRRSPRVLKAAT